MGFSLDVSVPALTVFLQGLLSFFSPCVLPLIPLYIGYLSGGTGVMGEDGRVYYKRSKVMLNTFFFVLGVSFAFFLLGIGVSAIGTFFQGNQIIFVRIGAVIIVLFGLYQLGIFGSSDLLARERRLNINLERFGNSPIMALILGFTFSFAWTPCVGPALASVLLMAASAGSRTAGLALIGVYTIGFVLPFLAVGLFTTSLLELFKKHRKVVKYSVKIGAVLMILMGLLMFTGRMNAITGYLSEFPGASGGQPPQETVPAQSPERTQETVPTQSPEQTQEPAPTESPAEAKPLPAPDFTLTDQYGEEHTLSDYKGKTVFLNFWATWCPPCRAEMPDIQKLYEEYKEAEDDSVVFLGIAAPNYGREKSEENIKAFLEENGYTYPVVMDEDGEIFTEYMVYSYPTTFMIDTEGNVFGYVTGQLSEDIMRSIIRQTVEGRMDQR